MNRFEPSTHRGVFGLAAITMSAVTMGVMVLLPAKLEFVDDPYASVTAAAKASTEVATAPARVDVPDVVDREEHLNPARATFGAQELYGKHHQLSSGSRSHI